jgi:hypothetical protein
MLNIKTLNVIDIFPVNEASFCLRAPNVKFKAMSEKMKDGTGYCNVYPEEYKEGLEPTLQRDVFVIPYIEKYYHNFLELFPKILFLKSINPFFKLIIVTNQSTDINPKTKVFYSWEKDFTDLDHNLSNVKAFLEMSEIEYICTSIDSKFFKEMVAQSAYIFFDFKKYIGNKRPNFYPINYDLPNSYPFHPTTAQTADSLFPYLKIMKGIHQDELRGNKKIYVSRKNFPERKLDNEESLEVFLSANGYEIVYFENLSIIDQIKTVKSAKEIIILNGSSAVNCMLANPRTKVWVFNNSADVVGIYEKASLEYNIEYNFIEMPNNDANWIIDYIKSNNIVKPL